MNTAYMLANHPLAGWLSSSDTPTWLVQDGDEPARDSLAIDALARSGDYFADLATRLEGLTLNDPAADGLLDHIVRELCYLERRYDIVRKQ